MSGTKRTYFLGTMSFSQPDWSGVFYPRDLKQTDWLEYYATAFNAVELDTTFYAIPSPERFQKWATVVPDEFRFAVKTPRTVTHDTPIDRATSEFKRFTDHAAALGEKLGAVLLQFPPAFGADNYGRLETFMRALPVGFRCAVEFRNASWFRKLALARVAELFAARNVAWTSAEYVVAPRPPIVTADFLYARWVGRHEQFSDYTHEQIDLGGRLLWWKDRFAALPPRVKTIYGFFNNDYAGYSVATCNRFKEIVGEPVNKPRPKQGELFG